MNIFQKNCPECAAPNSSGALTCRCGYCFDPEALAAADPAEYAHQQDRLYRDYLEARVAQAEAELTVARELASADPESTYKASTALLAEQSLNTLKAEMKQLSVRIARSAPARGAARSRPPKINGSAHTPASTKMPLARPNSVAASDTLGRSPKPAAPVRLPPPPIAGPIPSRTHAPAHQTKAKTALPAPRPAATVTPKPIQPAPTAPRATAMARPANAPRDPNDAGSLPGTPSRINGKVQENIPAISVRPDDAFRRLQTQKAEAIARSKSNAAAVAKPQRKPAVQAKPADIPPLVLLQRQQTQECPNCTASVSAELTRCGCGYMLQHPGEEVPALSLDATALAILTEGISSNSNRRR